MHTLLLSNNSVSRRSRLRLRGTRCLNHVTVIEAAFAGADNRFEFRSNQAESSLVKRASLRARSDEDLPE